MAVPLQSLLVAAYGLVRRSGVLDTAPGWRVYAAAYRAYKRLLDSDLAALRPHVTPGSLVIDVGANVGSSTLALAEWTGPGGHVIALEPEPRNAAELRRVIARAGRAGTVTVLEAAASDKPGRLNLAVNADNPADHRLADSGLGVEAVTLDALAERHAVRPVSVLKIDVQGAEPLVLAGAARLLADHRPAVMMELFGEGLAAFGRTPADLVAWMGERGYAAHLIERGQPRAADIDEIAGLCRREGYTDALFLHRPSSSAAMPPHAPDRSA